MTRPGHDGMPPQGPEFGEFLRRELHAAADQFEPRSDGLERIRARVRSGQAHATRHSAAQGGFLAVLVRRLNAARGGQESGSDHAQQPRDWRYGLLRPTLAAACVVFAIGVAQAIPPLRQAFVQLSSAVVGITSSSTGSGVPSVNGAGTQYSSGAGGTGQGGTSATQSGDLTTACSSDSQSSSAAKSAKSVAPSVTPASSATDSGSSG